MNVSIWLDEQLKSNQILSAFNLKYAKNILNKYGIKSKFYYCKVHNSNSIEKINPANKTIIITKRKLGIIRSGILSIGLVGKVNEIGGNIGIIDCSQSIQNNFPYILTHEILHLIGLKHCHTPSCIMSFLLCNRELKYCAVCSHKCKDMKLCEICKRYLDERRKNYQN